MQFVVASVASQTGDMETAILEPGTLIDKRYTIRRFIASGGVGHVYAATHRITGRDVALKMPRPNRAPDSLVHERLLREGRALALARHPGVVELVDGGEHDEAPYLALELLEGRTLGGLLAARGKLGWEEVLSLGRKVAEILAHCHARGVVHRDLKPDNLFALASGPWDVKLLDFGIARLAGTPAVDDNAKLTRAGSILGTPEYMAPEALLMEGTEDHRVDIYALGVLLFELLTGRVPFEGRYADVLVQVSTKPHPPLERPDAPPALLSTIERCLAKDPAARFQSMNAVALGLGSALSTPASVALGVASPADAPSEIKRTVADTPAAFREARAAGKRRFPRAPYTTPAELKLVSGEAVSGRIEEISEGGLQFIAARGLVPGERGEFRFATPVTGRVIRVPVTARWTKDARAARHATGFEFESLPEEALEAVRRYVELMGGS
jgi:serine/threonine-protein kinase